MTGITVACLDMAGTTVRDGGSVLEAFSAAIAAQNLPVAAYNQAMTDVRSSMGQSKIEVFRRILGDENAAQQANEAFEDHYAAAVRAGHVAAMPGATDVFKACRDAGIRVCLATGFSPTTRDAIISELGWGDLIDLALSPADARPRPSVAGPAADRAAVPARRGRQRARRGRRHHQRCRVRAAGRGQDRGGRADRREFPSRPGAGRHAARPRHHRRHPAACPRVTARQELV